MKDFEMKRGTRVKDSWFPEWGTGTVVKAMKHVWQIKWKNPYTESCPTDEQGIMKYDRQHIQFLEKV